MKKELFKLFILKIYFYHDPKIKFMLKTFLHILIVFMTLNYYYYHLQNALLFMYYVHVILQLNYHFFYHFLMFKVELYSQMKFNLVMVLYLQILNP